MSAEPRQTTLAGAWTKWPSQVVQGRFVLRRCLGWSDQGAVFLTEHKAKNLAEAAIKFVRADTPQAQPLLVRWQAAVNLSHPCLVQLFEVGRWQFEGQDYLFVVMEYGDQTLAEILRRRPLSAGEVQELLPPVLDALTFLHRRQLVHSQLQPSNFLAVGDQLKLASDTIRPAGQDHGTSTAGDVWSLGATLIEAITARARISIDHPFDVASLPAGLPATLVETVRRCLSPSPADRPSIIELRAEYKLAPQAAPVARPEPQVQKVSQVAAPPPPATMAPRVAAPTPPVPSPPRAAAPLQPVQTASRVTVSFHAVSNNSPASAQPQQAPNAAQGIAPPQAARTDSRAAIPAQPASTPREVPSPQSANTPSQAAALSQPVPSAPRKPAPPRPANAASQTTASSQPVSSAPREVAPLHPANIASRVTASSQVVSSAPPEVTPPQATNTAPRAAAPAQPAPSAPRAVAPPRPAPSSSQEAVASESAPKRHLLGIAAGALLLTSAVWIGLRSTNDSPAPLQPAAVPAPAPVAPSAPANITTSKPPLLTSAATTPEQPAPPAATSSSVLNEVLPNVPQKIQDKIQGRIHVTVRALVDPAGNVMGVLMENAGPSRYFARLSDEAARQWQFVAADTDAARVWLLRFEYTRNGVAALTLEQ